jgi:hypothetical protein
MLEVRSLFRSIANRLHKPQPAAGRILLNTLPKSGSVFLYRTLSESLRVPSMHLGNNYGLIDQISPEKLHTFVAGSFVAQSHLAPSPENLRQLSHFGCRVVLHIRDPRQALLSWLHHLDRIRDNAEALLLCAAQPPARYFEWDLARKLDWQIDHYLPLEIDWLRGWVAIHDRHHDTPVLLTTYEELTADIGKLCRRICDFAGIESNRFRLVDIPKTIDVHFRSGDDNEWRRVYSPAQIARANAMLAGELASRFGWLTAPMPEERPSYAA